MKPGSRLLPALLLAIAWAAVAAAPLPRKLIATGWDNPDTAQFRRDLQAMEHWPFDGFMLYAEGRGTDGQAVDGRWAFNSNHWERAWFSGALADLRAARSAKLTDNFLILLANPGNVDWFDDAGWKEIVEHARLLAWLAHAGGLKGLLFDPEPYTEPFSQFRYSAQAAREQHSFDEYYRKARERGREFMTAVVAEFPEVVLFSYFLFGESAAVLHAGAEPERRLVGHGYGLLPAFANGWFDVLPPRAVIVDGNERAYRYNREAAFDAAFVELKNDCQAFVAPENRPRFRAQFQVSHGIYLDAYVNPPNSPWFIDGLGGPRVDRLEQNVASGLRAADEYVWVYGEKARWWPPRRAGDKVAPRWPDLLPDADLALLSAKDPAAGTQRRLNAMRARGHLTNLLDNATFAVYRNDLPESWSIWQDEKTSHGQFRDDPTVGAASTASACLSGVDHGCFVQAVKATPDRRYLVSAKVRQSGQGVVWLAVRWQTGEGRWTAEDRDVRFAPLDRKDPGEWQDIVGSVRVPEGAGRLVVLLGVNGQRTPADRVWYDDAWLVAAD